MRQIKNENLARLLLQLRFTPVTKRRKQLDAAEKLLAIIEPGKEYPFDFVHFKITGFHPKPVLSGAEGTVTEQLIKGEELLEDLRIFVAKLSGQLAGRVSEQKEKVYTIEELAEAFGVSTKTIYRWRKQGLIARKYIFDVADPQRQNGQRRFGFLQSAVDKFAKINPVLIAKARNFKRLTKKQKQQIIRQARNLAAKTTMSRYQIVERIAAKIGRAHETVRYTLLQYEKSHPQRTVFNKLTRIISPTDAAELYRLYTQGVSIAELVNRFGRNRSSIYRIVNQQRARALLAKKIEFITSDEFVREGAREKILTPQVRLTSPVTRDSSDKARATGHDQLLPQYLQTLKDSPVLNRERELELFRRYNYLKYLAWKNRADIKLSHVSGVKLIEIENYLAQAEAIKKIIVEANLRLVVSIASKHTTSTPNLLDLITELEDLGRMITEGIKPGGVPSVRLSEIENYIADLRIAAKMAKQHTIRGVNLPDLISKLQDFARIIRLSIQPGKTSSTRISEIESYLAEAEAIKNIIIESNLRLVVSIAGKHATSGANFLDLVSEGNFALIKAVEEFDYTRGVRFGKFASLNIAKEYAKVSGKSTELSRKRAASLADVRRDLASAADIAAIERARQSLTQVIKDELDQREQYVILNHFGLVGSKVIKQTKTLKQIGDDLGLTKERARQIELIALQKLRQSLSSEEFELLTG